MKRGGGVHTAPAQVGTGWCNKLDGRIVSRHRVKYEAVRAGKEIARLMQVEHTIHRADGVITEKNSYGADSFPPRG